jgi:polynucleotide 5'-triphosphatase
VAEAHPQNPEALRRVPIDYLHRRETDKFYELPTSHHASLPPAVRERLNTRHPVKVRVTYAQDPKEPKTILAKIIKARIADIDIYNPQSPLDCRISINFEMRYDGDVEELKAISIDSRIPDRNKDRLSYKQSHYQVDLTQVTQLSLANVSLRRSFPSLILLMLPRA